MKAIKKSRAQRICERLNAIWVRRGGGGVDGSTVRLKWGAVEAQSKPTTREELIHDLIFAPTLYTPKDVLWTMIWNLFLQKERSRWPRISLSYGASSGYKGSIFVFNKISTADLSSLIAGLLKEIFLTHLDKSRRFCQSGAFVFGVLFRRS